MLDIAFKYVWEYLQYVDFKLLYIYFIMKPIIPEPLQSFVLD